jgi:prohibitin 2
MRAINDKVTQEQLRLKVATAEAQAMQVQNGALAKSKDVLELRRIEVELAKEQRWNRALPTSMYGSAPVAFMNVWPSTSK